MSCTLPSSRSYNIEMVVVPKVSMCSGESGQAEASALPAPCRSSRDPDAAPRNCPDPAVTTVQETVADVVRRTPDAVAVRSGELCLTYAELWR